MRVKAAWARFAFHWTPTPQNCCDNDDGDDDDDDGDDDDDDVDDDDDGGYIITLPCPNLPRYLPISYDTMKHVSYDTMKHMKHLQNLIN